MTEKTECYICGKKGKGMARPKVCMECFDEWFARPMPPEIEEKWRKAEEYHKCHPNE